MMNVLDEKDFFASLLDMLENHFGDELEVVLHSGQDKAHSIADIRNGYITHRKAGDGADKHGLQVYAGTTKNGNNYGEIVYTDDGKILKGSTVAIKNQRGEKIGSVCINQDITKYVEFSDYLKRINPCNLDPKNARKDISTILEDLIQESLVFCGKNYSAMTKEDKMQFLKYLDDKGAFLISKSGPKICEKLQISKYTLYSYLEIIRSQNTGDE